MITFKTISSFKRGQLFQMLKESYRDLIKKYATADKLRYLHRLQQTDHDAFDNPGTIGKCILVTYLGDKAIGFAAFDPGHFPDYGVTGKTVFYPGTSTGVTAPNKLQKF